MTYCRTSFTMVIVDIGRRKISDERAYVFLLEPGVRHDGELHGTFYCRFAHASVLKAAAPNQLFKPSDLIDQRAILEVHDGLSDDSSADESDHDPEQDRGLGADDVPTWDKDADGGLKFKNSMPHCYRSLANPDSTFHGPSIPGLGWVSGTLQSGDIFECFFSHRVV